MIWNGAQIYTFQTAWNYAGHLDLPFGMQDIKIIIIGTVLQESGLGCHPIQKCDVETIPMCK